MPLFSRLLRSRRDAAEGAQDHPQRGPIGKGDGQDASADVASGEAADDPVLDAALVPRAKSLLAAQQEQRLIVTEYPYTPRVRDYPASPGGRMLVDLCREAGTRTEAWMEQVRRFEGDLRRIEREADFASGEPGWINGMLPPLDGMLLYAFVRALEPQTYLEVGSGNSTKFVRRAISDGGLKTRIVSIDPHPRAVIDALCDEVVRAPFETVGSEAYLSRIQSGDIVFIDNSHRSFQNSDVTVFFTEMLPGLPSGVTYGVHDIFLPYDYPEDWLDRFYNEQYLLAAYLLGGAAGDRIEFPGIYAVQAAEHAASLQRIFSLPEYEGLQRHAGAFWMRRA